MDPRFLPLRSLRLRRRIWFRRRERASNFHGQHDESYERFVESWHEGWNGVDDLEYGEFNGRPGGGGFSKFDPTLLVCAFGFLFEKGRVFSPGIGPQKMRASVMLICGQRDINGGSFLYTQIFGGVATLVGSVGVCCCRWVLVGFKVKRV